MERGLRPPPRGGRPPFAEGRRSNTEIIADDFIKIVGSLQRLTELKQADINEFMDKLGTCLASSEEIATTQLRKVYGEMRRLQREAALDPKMWSPSKLDIFEPRLAYAAARKRELTPIYTMFKACRPKIQEKTDLDRFVATLEALVAYHRYHRERRRAGQEGWSE